MVANPHRPDAIRECLKVRALAEDPTVPRAAYVSTEAIGGAEGGLIGGLMYVGAVVSSFNLMPNTPATISGTRCL